MTDLSSFWDRKAQSYAAQPIADEAAYQRKLAITRSYFRPDMEVLELGCGTGATAVLHAPFVRHIKAVDFSAEMIGIGRERAKTAGVGNVTFARADITALDEAAESYDAVLTMSLLHLLARPEELVRQVYRMLKPGGVYVSSTTCLGDTAAMFKYIAPLGRAIGLLPLLNVMRRDELRGHITGGGFDIEHDWRPSAGKAVFIVARKPAA